MLREAADRATKRSHTIVSRGWCFNGCDGWNGDSALEEGSKSDESQAIVTLQPGLLLSLGRQS